MDEVQDIVHPALMICILSFVWPACRQTAVVVSSVVSSGCSLQRSITALAPRARCAVAMDDVGIKATSIVLGARATVILELILFIRPRLAMFLSSGRCIEQGSSVKG